MRDRLHQDTFHLRCDARVYLGRSRVLAEIENKKRIVLRVRAGQHVEYGSAKGIDIGPGFDFACEQLGRRITHRADRGHAFFRGTDDTSDPKIDEHYSFGLVIQHQVCRFEIAINNWRLLCMYVVEHIANLNGPFAYGSFIGDAATNSHLLREIAAADPSHDKIIPAGLDKVVEYGWNRRVIELSEHFGFAFEVFDGFSALALIGEHFDHLFDRAQLIGQPLVTSLIDGS